MDFENIEKNLLLTKIIENSTFTKRQIQIIYNICNREKKPSNISSGAYYREIKQCKEKIKETYYSLIIFSLLGLLGNEQIVAINSIANKISSLQESSKTYHNKNVDNVIDIINQIVNKISL